MHRSSGTGRVLADTFRWPEEGTVRMDDRRRPDSSIGRVAHRQRNYEHHRVFHHHFQQRRLCCDPSCKTLLMQPMAGTRNVYDSLPLADIASHLPISNLTEYDLAQRNSTASASSPPPFPFLTRCCSTLSPQSTSQWYN